MTTCNIKEKRKLKTQNVYERWWCMAYVVPVVGYDKRIKYWLIVT
jgi:hypothetical protein